jgi:hypothetical protein
VRLRKILPPQDSKSVARPMAAVMPLLLQIKALGSLREGLFYVAAGRFEPAAVTGDRPVVATSVTTAILVLIAWTVIPLALGAWRTQTRDA